ncbi:Cytosolic carboxypeptidase 3 [Acipenser ruthenus]|uniref:Cytosolic carboxypeptidase 3 n=1 Tax=Acipenser ruthenus TaxID=7906 RepID=A0A444U4N3_ACIRT|nr:Cytosolic carboxypeptidase 3 [Acipenser ruthenus]
MCWALSRGRGFQAQQAKDIHEELGHKLHWIALLHALCNPDDMQVVSPQTIFNRWPTGSPWQESLKSELETELEEKKQSALRSPPRREHKRVKRPADKQVPRGQREALQETQTTDDLSASFLPLMSRSTWRSCIGEKCKLFIFRKYSKDAGFTELVCKKGKRKLKDLANGFFRYKNGIVVSRHGPFWPVGFRQLCPTPVHIIICPDAEALWSKDTQGLDCKMGIMSQPWRRKVLVFDSEKYTKNPLCQMPEDSGPSLQFESSGEFEYELLLKTDLFTNKHTQWYYFQVKNAVPGVTYKFRIINLLKRDSLYNHGMKPLVYSEKGAKEGQVGWFRSGHHIVYKPWNNPSYNILLLPFVQYYCLEFLIEFSHAEDTYYLAHSYPYHYSTLLSHLNGITEDPQRSAYVKKEALCKTLARNTCFLLTVTDFEVNTAESCSSKLGVVLTARVHPGETPSSWVMKGVLDFLTSEEPLAQILLYCDLHGHSRKPHVFMYGCNQASAESSSVSSHLRERIFPFLVSQKNTRRAAMVNPLFVNRYANRSNGGIPIYSQERLLERAKKKEEIKTKQKEQLSNIEVSVYIGIGLQLS